MLKTFIIVMSAIIHQLLQSRIIW